MFLDRSVIGLDLSLTSTGYCYYIDGVWHNGRIRPKKISGMERLSFIVSEIKQHLTVLSLTEKKPMLTIEGYSMGSKGRAFDIGELGGVVKLFAWEKGFDVLLVPPSSLKLFVAGKGNANKQEMMEAVKGLWGFETKYHDEADAFGLHQLGRYYSLNGKRARGSARKKALQGIQYMPSI